MRRLLIITLLAGFCMAGCTITRHIEDLEPPKQPPLQELESHLNYHDPDAGQPDYVR